MLKKNRKSLLLASGLFGALTVATVAGVALSSCTTTSSTTPSTKPDTTDVEYTSKIDWDDSALVNELVKDEQGLVYSDNTKTTVIALDPNSDATTITLPDTVTTISGYINTTGSGESQTTTQIGAFEGNTSIITIKVSSGSKLTTINKRAFSGCTALTSLSDTSGVTKIGTSAFNGCTSLQAITLNNVQVIGNGAFYKAFSSEADVAITLSNVSSISTGAFYQSNVTSVSIGNTTSLAIGPNAFESCARLAAVTFTNTATNASISLGDNAFARCNSLISLTFPSPNADNSNLITTNKYTFAFCTSLVSTHLGNIGVIGYNAFDGCTKLTTVTLPTNSDSVLSTIGANAFTGCSSLTTVAPLAATGSEQVTGFVSTDSMLVIGASAFANTAIKSIDLTNFSGTIVNGVTMTGSIKSFANIGNLTNVNLGTAITTLEVDDKQQGLFYGSGTSGDGFDIVLPSSINNISQYAFAGSGVKSIDMSKVKSYSTTADSALALPNYLFNGATKLTSVVLKDGTTSIGEYGFQNCSSLKVVKESSQSSVTSGYVATNTITSIGTNAFTGAFAAGNDATIDLSASKITEVPIGFTSGDASSIKLPSAITTTGVNTFFGNTSIASLTFGASEITSNSLLFTGANITTHTNKTATPASYKAANVPFGNNSALTALNYNSFASTGEASSATNMQTLFETTNADTWTEVAKIINSLSCYAYLDGEATTNKGVNIPINLSAWTAEATPTRTSKIYDDTTIKTTETSGKLSKIVFDKCFSAINQGGALGDITIEPTTPTNKFIHNGVTWTYTNSGSAITLTGDVNMYKTSVTSKDTTSSYLTFFDSSKVQAQPSVGQSTTYNIPSQAKVKVTLTIASK